MGEETIKAWRKVFYITTIIILKYSILLLIISLNYKFASFFFFNIGNRNIPNYKFLNGADTDFELHDILDYKIINKFLLYVW
jgi:hypothetical protein